MWERSWQGHRVRMNAKIPIEVLFAENSKPVKSHGVTWHLVVPPGRIGWDLGQEFTIGTPMSLLKT